MSQHHSESNAQHFYEGDQSALYSGLMNHHFGHDLQSEGSKKQVGRIWKIFWVLLIITIAEVIMGMFFSHQMPKALVATFFLGLTLLKAGYIVSVFMHLGDELKNFMIAVLIPLALFIWFIIAFLYDGGFWLERNANNPSRNNPTQVIESHS